MSTRRPFSMWSKATLTQSVGVPVRVYISRPSSLRIFSSMSVSVRVMAWLRPLCGVSGATAITSPIPRATSTAAAKPAEAYPSSLVTKMSLLCCIAVVKLNQNKDMQIIP